MSTLDTPARQKAFKANGIELFGKDKKFRDVFTLIHESLDKTGADPKKMHDMFANIVGARSVGQLSNLYLTASGGRMDAKSKAAGHAAVQAEMDRMTKGAEMSNKEVDDSFAKKMGSMESKAELFQQNLDKITGSLADKLLPAMEQLAPRALDVASALGNVVSAAAKNPAATAVGVVVAGGAKSVMDGIGASVGKTIAAALAGTLGFGAITTLTVASVGFLALNKVLDDSADADKRSREAATKADNAGYATTATAGALATNWSLDNEESARKAREANLAEIEELRKKIASGQAYKDDVKQSVAGDDWDDMGGGAGRENTYGTSRMNSLLKWSMLGGIISPFGGGQDSKEYDDAERNAETMAALVEQLNGLETRLAQALAGTTLNV
ncbi:MAG: hypothetical protein EON94_13400, partial [Caulobacteraceae bacterium]